MEKEKGLCSKQVTELIDQALKARENAYMPYSHYAVGAALLAKNGRIFCGCNVENASYGATNCAERTAFFKAVSEGERAFLAIAVCGGKEGEPPKDFAYPCGICRQVMAEFCDTSFQVIVAKSAEEYRVYTQEELMPESFSL